MIFCKRKRRVIDQLRSHSDLTGDWSYDRDANEWKRADGLRVYARSHCSIGVNGGESYFTRWYKQIGDRVEQIWGIA